MVFTQRQRDMKALAWTGTDMSGRAAGEGAYRIKVSVEYENGNAPVRESEPVLLDLSAPKARVAAETSIFSPDGDGKKDTIRLSVSDATEEREWHAEIVYQEDGGTVRSASWTGKPADFTWDGLDDDGFPAPEGPYVFRLSSMDEAGNEFTAATGAFILDIKETPVSIRVGASGFSPNADGVKDTIDFDLYLPVSERIDAWSIRFLDEGGGAARTVSGKGSAPGFASYSWDGKTDAGSRAAEGAYRAEFRVSYEKGADASAMTVPFVLDVSPPAVSLAFSPLPFSPDGDGENDLLTIKLDASDKSQTSDWELVIRDRAGNFFARFSGAGSPSAGIPWNGLSATGELVLSAEDYAVEAIVSDAYGNVGKARSTIPVDILVIKEGSRYRIRVPGIYFSPFSAEFPPDRLAENMETLRRLAAVLAKYPAYNIRVEGNAVRINWADRKKGEEEEKAILAPLSLARAEKVRAILVSLGIEASRMTTAGLGGTVPLVPHSDLDNRWKNRRVDFVLIRR